MATDRQDDYELEVQNDTFRWIPYPVNIALSWFDVWKWRFAHFVTPKSRSIAYRRGGRYGVYRPLRYQHYIEPEGRHDFENPVYDNATAYTYEQLSCNDSTRLLTIYPGSWESPLRCSLTETPFSENAVYTALSYTWGSQVTDVLLDCDGKILYITRNLANALRRIRSERIAYAFWIDAVCINQSDPLERSQQVSLMKRIYESAADVLVWLGEEAEDSSLACDIVKRIYEEAAREDRNGDPLSWYKPLDSQDLKDRVLPEPWTKDWIALEKLCFRPWFRRTWIIQEVVLARQAQILCGPDSVSWAQLSTAATYIETHKIPVNNIFFISRLATYKNQYTECPQPLVKLLFLSSESEVTNPRDKIYGLLGICNDADARAIVPDYQKSIVEVLTEVAALQLRSCNLEVLTALSDPSWRLTPPLPSWVPDWPNDPRVSALGRLPGMNAGADLAPQVRFTGPNIALPNTLLLSGVITDAVSTVGYVMAQDSEVQYGRLFDENTRTQLSINTRCQIVHQWRRLLKRIVSYPRGEQVHEAFCRTIVANILPELYKDGWPRQITVGELFHAATATWLQPIWKDVDDEFWQQHPLVKRGIPAAEVRAAVLSYAASINRISPHHRFFITRKGYIGLGPRSTRPGDSVAVFPGARTPFVLRRARKDNRTIIGECYVHGIMDGECVAEVDGFEEIKVV